MTNSIVSLSIAKTSAPSRSEYLARALEFGLKPSGPELIRVRIKTLIQENLSDPDFRIERLSSMLDCTKRYLHMSFAGEGMTITRYIWQRRLEKCLEELEFGPRSGRTLTDIAFSWGFSSSSHFTHLFKKRYGIAPSAVQRRAMPGDRNGTPLSAV